jgi:beta-phosphoglucomutase-like phosphatase (HAD superfamily)
MTWVAALREHAKQTGKFAVPKRGTPEYDAVKKIQESMAAPAPEVKAAAVKATTDHKERKVRKAAAAVPTAEELAARGAAEKAAARVADAKAKADAKAAKAAAKAAKAAKEIADAEAVKVAEAAKPKPVIKRIAAPVGPAVAVHTKPKAPRKPKLKIAEGSGVSVAADPIVSFA